MSAHGSEVTVASTPAALAKLRTFHTLDALRGVAAMTVVLFHSYFFFGLSKPAEGGMAVDLFFAMSGFIIAHRYEADLRGGMSLLRFVQVRLVRLYPLFILGAFLGFVPAVIAVLSGHTDPVHEGMVESFGLAVFMLPSWIVYPKIEFLYPLNGVAWSLALELVINIAYAATVSIWTVRRLLIALAIAFAALCVCAVVYGDMGLGYEWASVPVGLARIAYAFTAGLLIERLYRGRSLSFTVPWWAILIAALALFCFAAPYARPAWEVFALSVVVPLIVIAAVSVEPPKVWRGLCALCGVFSYVVYSLHAPLIGLFLRGEDRLHIDIHSRSPWQGVAYTAVVVLVCIVANALYDKPVRRIMTGWLRRGAGTRSARPRSPFRGKNIKDVWLAFLIDAAEFAVSWSRLRRETRDVGHEPEQRSRS